MLNVSGAQGPATSPPGGGPRHAKRALIVAIATYAPGTGWSPLASAEDVPLVRGALEGQGFASSAIRELRDAQATREGILKAMRELLLAPAGEGDILVFHYSGHGQQITDDGDDEGDGYDETIVPYDAPSTERPGYAGERHLRDDDLAEQFQAMRARVGPSGNVVAFFDSCNSGAITRGTAAVRGAPPLGPPRKVIGATRGSTEAGGYFELPRTRGTGAPSSAGLAPYVVLSAAASNQYNHEMRTPTGRAVGPLSYSLSVVLAGAGPRTSYSTVFDGVKTEMQKGRVPNQPQIEGDENTAIFNGQAVLQPPFIRIAAVSAEGASVTLEGGLLVGLNPGTRVELHPSGTVAPTVATKLGEGEVTGTTPTTATVKLARSSDPAKLRGGRAFVTSYTFGPLPIRASLKEIADATARARVEQRLASVPAVKISAGDADVNVVQRPGVGGEIIIEDGASGVVIGGPFAANSPQLGNDVANHLLDYARNQFLRRLTLSQKDLAARLDIVPVRLSKCSDPDNPDEDTCTVTPVRREDFLTPGRTLEFPKGTYFKLRVHTGARDAYLTVLDLAPDGRIAILSSERQPSARSRTHDLKGLWVFTDPPGVEVLMLVAAQEWVDFASLASLPLGGTRGQGPARGSMGAFAEVFDDAARGTRAAPVIPKGQVSTFMLPVSVKP